MLDVEERLEVPSVRLVDKRSMPALAFRPWVFIAGDVGIVYLALCMAYWTRYVVNVGSSAGRGVDFLEYQWLAAVLTVVIIPVLVMKGAYRRRLSTEVVDDVIMIVSASTIAVASIIVVTFMLHRFEYSRGVIVYLWLFVIALLAVGRALTRWAQGMCHRKGWRVRKVLVVGATDAGKMLMQSVRSRPDLGYDIVGFVDRRSAMRAPCFGRFQRLGSVSDLPQLIERDGIDEVIVTLPGSAHEELRSVVGLCEQRGVSIKLVPDLFELSLSRVQVEDIAGIPLLDVREKPIRRMERAVKRGVDLVVGSAVLMLTLPITGVLALLVRLESRGPAFIKQERLGKDGRPFTCFKLRSMRADAEQLRAMLLTRNEATGPIFKIRDDPRRTRVGRWLRRLSLDELPQIWNVVRGDMSLVGPRPPLAREVTQYEPWQLRRLEVKPGITGIWQVSGRSDLTFDEMVMMDIMYVDHWSPGLDMKILLRTAAAVLAGRGAY